jgi:glycine/D-amino acid oxidase-like deaminating enzyme
MPEDHAFELFELDWKVFESHMRNACEMVPAFETAGIKTTVCGSECFTADLKPLLGKKKTTYKLTLF